jgi:hypothetical protein
MFVIIVTDRAWVMEGTIWDSQGEYVKECHLLLSRKLIPKALICYVKHLILQVEKPHMVVALTHILCLSQPRYQTLE